MPVKYRGRNKTFTKAKKAKDAVQDKEIKRLKKLVVPEVQYLDAANTVAGMSGNFAVAGAFLTSGGVGALNAMATGNVNGTRVGLKTHGVRWDVSVFIDQNGAFNTQNCRLIFFQWFDAAAPTIAGGILVAAQNQSMIFPPYQNKQYHILHDTGLMCFGGKAAGATPATTSPKTFRKSFKIKDSRYTANAVGDIVHGAVYILAIGDVGCSYAVYSRYRYTD